MNNTEAKLNESGFDGVGVSGEEGCGASIEAAIRFSGDKIVQARFRAEGASTALAAARNLSSRIEGVRWEVAASIRSQDVTVAAREAGTGGKRRCPPERAAFFAIDALHRAIEDSLRRERFPRAAQAQQDAVIVAMSGGVDSATACLLEKRSGKQVTGVTMRLWSDPAVSDSADSCCSPEAIEQARSICHQLGVPHITVDCSEAFEQTVVRYFESEYSRGRTPNPCTWCNGYFRFPFLASLARHLGAATVATGHYARIVEYNGEAADKCKLLARGKDRLKDQSYMLWSIDPGLLPSLAFPLGEILKPETRETAAAAGLEVYQRPESQEVCFIPDNNYRRFLRTRLDELPGPGEIVDLEGIVLGRHESIVDYTVGQRRGLGVSATEPLYVIRTDPELNRVVAGTRKELAVRSLTLEKVNSFLPRDAIKTCDVQARYNSDAVAARVEWGQGGRQDTALVKLEAPIYGIAPGQSAVLYQGDLVLAGGVITATT